MAELCLMSQTVEEIVKKPRLSCSNSVDLTLRLPDHILHSVFSYLTSQDLVNVHLVSKNWRRNTPSYFAFNFDESLFLENVPSTPLRIIHETHNKFLDWIRSSLETSKSKLNKAEKRVLRILFYFHENIYDIMRLMDENDFHEVYLRFEYFYYSSPYIFQLKSTCLTVLHLTACTLDENVFHDEAKFTSLQEVKLDDVRVSGETLSKFISKCPNIRELSLEGCKFLYFIVLPKLDRLEKLYVNNPHIHHHPISNIEVVAPSLQLFHWAYCNRIKVAVRMNIRACRMLRELHLDCWKFPEGLDHEHFCSDFPHLETLYLGPCETLKRVKISSSSLRNLTLMFTQLYNYNYSRKSVVSAPNLCYFHYVGRTFKSSLAPSDTPKLLEKNCISLVPHIEKINRAWFLQLRSHLKKISNHIGLVLVIREETSFSDLGKRGHKLWSIPIGRAPTQLLPHIKHLKLDIRLKVPEESHGCLMKYIIDNLLLMSQPNALTLSMPASCTEFALGVCNQLFISRRESNCCTDTQDKCWRHFLKDFVVKEQVSDDKDKMKKLSFVFTWQFFS